jgi:bacterial/archaeal transporter family-2 protein
MKTMSSNLLLLLVAVIGGVAVTMQAQFMGLMDRHLGTVESVFITYGSGALVVGVVMLLLRGGNLRAWSALPWYAFLAGVIGLLIVGAIGYSVPRLGLVPALTLIVAAQFIAAAVLDHYGLLGAAVRPLDAARALGILVLLLGVWLIIR